MVTSRPDPEYWKNLYGDEWESAAEAVKSLHEKIVQRSPGLEDSVKFGLGATTGKRVRIPPGQKHEADITYYYDYKLLCGIQVSAPQKGRVPPGDIWVLNGKYEQAVAKEAMGEKTWFYFDYPLTKKNYALDMPTIKPFEKNVEIMYLKRDSMGRWVPEPYIKIPYQKAFSGDALLDWIGQEIARRKKP
ncbi:hypothetical protein ES703_63412 [subsurface metagenome]